jgi:hypothetical protein
MLPLAFLLGVGVVHDYGCVLRAILQGDHRFAVKKLLIKKGFSEQRIEVLRYVLPDDTLIAQRIYCICET